jgi:hypothetical protein
LFSFIFNTPTPLTTSGRGAPEVLGVPISWGIVYIFQIRNPRGVSILILEILGVKGKYSKKSLESQKNTARTAGRSKRNKLEIKGGSMKNMQLLNQGFVDIKCNGLMYN